MTEMNLEKAKVNRELRREALNEYNRISEAINEFSKEGFDYVARIKTWERGDWDDLISRQAAIDALADAGIVNYAATGDGNGMLQAVNVIKALPSAQPSSSCAHENDQDLQPTCNKLATDCISRQAAQERQRVSQKRKYTFGNDEFSLEAAYHDCKLVFDGITDDNSFQEADTGLVLYYANEIIYALHEALEGKDTNVSSRKGVFIPDITVEMFRNASLEGVEELMASGEMEDISLPSAQPERTKGEWITDDLSGIISCSRCGNAAPMETTGGRQYKSKFCQTCGADMRGGQDDGQASTIDVEEALNMAINVLTAQPEITDEQAIEHLQETGWMQNHDKQMYEMGLREQLADDSDSYDALLPSAQPEERTQERTETHVCDLISRQAAIDAADSIINRDISGNNDVVKAMTAWKEYIEALSPAQPEVVRCKDCKFYSPMNRETKTGICDLIMHQNFGDNWFCAGAERRTDEQITE